MIYTYEACCGVPVWERVCSYAAYLADPSFCCGYCGKDLKQTITRVTVMAQSSFDPFVSPVDGSVIRNRADLAEHNKRNDVVNIHDGYDEKAVMAMTADTFKSSKQERLRDLNIDMEQAVQKLEDGYKPTPAPYTEELPDA